MAGKNQDSFEIFNPEIDIAIFFFPSHCSSFGLTYVFNDLSAPLFSDFSIYSTPYSHSCLQ